MVDEDQGINTPAPEKTGQAVVRLRNEGWSYGDIAKHLKITRGAVAGHVYRNKEQINDFEQRRRPTLPGRYELP